MSYSFQYTVNKNIGKLSWGMTVSPGEKTVCVIVGEWVETKENFFVSGVWDGEFQKGEFHTAEFFCGGGVRLEGEKIIASSSTHERQRLVFMKKDSLVYVSNSVPFLLALTGEKPDVNCDRYEGILCSIIEGLSDYQKEIPLAGGRVMYQIFSSDLIIDEALHTEIRRKQAHRDFVDFDDYYTSMKNVCAKILENGKSEERAHPYDMITTTSSGYDSSGCAAVGYEAGCTQACTFKDGKYDEDSGAEIAEKIGYRDIIKAG